MTQLMSEYKIGRNGYILLLSENGTFVYHPDNDIIQKNIEEVKISQNVADTINSKSNAFLKYKTDGVTKYGYLLHAGFAQLADLVVARDVQCNVQVSVSKLLRRAV